MSIIEKAIGKAHAAEAGRNDAAYPARPGQAHPLNAHPPELRLADVTPVRTVRIAVDERDPLGAVWRGSAPDAVLNHFRSLRRELLLLLGDTLAAGMAPVVLVTSALPGDGKTFVAASVARTFAKAPDFKVSLLDLDLVRRTTSLMFNAENLPGIADCLAGTAELRGVTCATDVPQLRFISAGSSPSDSREQFVGDRLDDLVAKLRSSGRNCIHVVDAPPVIPVVETALLASKVDLVLFVVRAGVTPQAAVAEALARLGRDARVTVLLNGVTQPVLGSYYDYDYSAYASQRQQN